MVFIKLAVGPDALDTIHCKVEQLSLTFTASELRLRGTASINQPHTDEAGNILCWNGEVWLPAFLVDIFLIGFLRYLKAWT